MGGQKLRHFNRVLEAVLRREGGSSDGLWERIAADGGSIQMLPDIPQHTKMCFKVAREIAPEWHVKIQSTFQGHVDNAITKTVNLPPSADSEEVGRVYELAWRSGCKGITIYRQGSRTNESFVADPTDSLSCKTRASCDA